MLSNVNNKDFANFLEEEKVMNKKRNYYVLKSKDVWEIEKNRSSNSLD